MSNSSTETTIQLEAQPNSAPLGATSCSAGFYLSNKVCLACPATCTSCSSSTVCKTCKTNFTLQSGACKCLGIFTAPSKCAFCSAGNYFNTLNSVCEKCSIKTPKCSTCDPKTGVCTKCASTYTLNTTSKTCVCATGLTDNGTSCVSLSKCVSGFFNNGKNVCLACDSTCATCAAVTGNCLTCKPNTK